MYPVSVFNSSLTLQAQIDDYEYLKWDFRYRTVDSFELRINRYKNNVSYLIAGNIISLYINDEYRAGLIESRELALTQEGKLSETLIIIGRGLDGLMSERIALTGTDSGDGYDTQDDDAETVMRYYVNANCISSSDTDRNYSLLELETDQERGGNVEYEARFQYLDKILEDISLASGLGWEINLDAESKKFKFHVLQGVDRSWENGVNSPVMFTPEFGNIRLLGYKSSRINSKNVVYVAGQGEADSRTVQQVDKDGSSYTDITRRELFIDARDLGDTDKLTQRGNEKLSELGEETIVEAENLTTGPFEFGTDFYVGDIVTVKYPDVVETDTRIIQASMEITREEGLVNKLVFGRQYPDLINILKLQNENMSGEIRR